MHQDVHDIVAEAAYLSIAIRLSKTIFRFEFPEPGQQWDIDQDNTEPGIYNASKAARDDELQHGGRGATSSTMTSPSIARVHIVLWPNLQRWSPGRPAESDIAFDEDDDMVGQTVSTILNAQVAYYAGSLDDDEVRASHSILRYIEPREAVKTPWRTWLMTLALTLLAGVGATLLSARTSMAYT
jgi:hypothetical protein